MYKRFLTLCLFTVAAVGCSITSASAADIDIKLNTKVSKSKHSGSSKKPVARGLTFGFTSTARTSASDSASPIQTLSIKFDDQIRFNLSSKSIKTCKKKTLKSVDGCSKSSRLNSSGLATTVLFPISFDSGQPSDLFMHKADKDTFYVLASPQEVGLSAIVTGEITKSSVDGFGSEITLSFPSLPASAGSLAVLFQSLSLTTKKNFAKTTGCSGGSYQFAATATFNDGEVQERTSTAKC